MSREIKNVPSEFTKEDKAYFAEIAENYGLDNSDPEHLIATVEDKENGGTKQVYIVKRQNIPVKGGDAIDIEKYIQVVLGIKKKE